MKNRHVENLKKGAKQYHRRQRHDRIRDGMLILHDYSGLLSDRLTWRDEVTFINNDYRVALAWIHPRMAFEDAVDAETDRLVPDLYVGDFMRKGNPICSQ